MRYAAIVIQCVGLVFLVFLCIKPLRWLSEGWGPRELCDVYRYLACMQESLHISWTHKLAFSFKVPFTSTRWSKVKVTLTLSGRKVFTINTIVPFCVGRGRNGAEN
jgi:hypothetical protein